MDVDALENGDADAVQGGGGYVDDDLDLDDDDDDDEPLLATPSRPPPSGAKSLKRRSTPTTATPESKKRRKDTSAAHPDDFILRAAGTGELRDYVVAKFVTRVPELAPGPHVRLFRQAEPTVTARQRAIEANQKQQNYYNSFSGKRRLARYAKQGIVTIPDRYRRGWAMEVIPQHVQEERARRMDKDRATGVKKPVGKNGLPDVADENTEAVQMEKEVDAFEGTFDGKSTSRYAIMVMRDGSKTVDVVPVDEYAWFSFRTNRAQGVESTEATEALMAKYARKGRERISKFQGKYEEAQGIREQGMGDNSRIKSSKEFAGVGIRRSNVKREGEDGEDVAREQMDFEQEFDDDDLAQEDKETRQKTETRVLGDAEQHAKDFRKMIKDEPIPSRPTSPGSESEEEGGRKSPRPTSRSPSPSRPTSTTPRSPNRSKSTPSVHGRSRQPTPMGMTPSASTPFGVSPSPNRSPTGNTPQRLNLSHLLPPAGQLPNVEQVRSVLTVLLQGKSRISFREMVKYFERRTKEQKENLIKIIRQVSVVTADPPESKSFYISWRTPA